MRSPLGDRTEINMTTINEYYRLFKEELLEYCVPFWLNNAQDKKNGGIINCLDRKGEVYSTDKSVWMQGRCGWMFSYLYNKVYKNEDFLKFAGSCIGFAKDNCIDKADGRMYFTVTKEGEPLRKRRYWFSETFYIIANAEYYMASGDKAYLDEAKKYYAFVLGMYKDPCSDPYKITPKSIDKTRAAKALANPMIMLNVTSIMRDADPAEFDYYNGIISELIEDIKEFYKPEYHAMLENIGLNGELYLESAPMRVVNPGHDIECSWFLLEEGIRRSDSELISFAQTVFDDAFERGWDKEYGGLFYFKDLLGKPVEAYEHDMKLWWPHNEAVIASLMLYKQTKDEKYFKIFKQVCDYAFEKFSDREYGEWYGYLRRDGKPTEPPCKGHTYKGPFHVMRMLAKCIVVMQDMI